MIEIKQQLQFTTGPRGRRRISSRPRATKALPTDRVPRIAKLMALAIRFDGLIRDGVVADQSQLARLAKITQPRMTQIMNLLHLAPDIQEELLFLPAAVSGREPIHEKLLRPVAVEMDWQGQRIIWTKLTRGES
jgi:hypothetical protein